MNFDMLRKLGVPPNRTRVLEMLSSGPATKKEIMKALKLNGHHLYKVLSDLVESGWVERTGRGIINDPYVFRISSIKKIIRNLEKDP
jgi:sugar-specific transcriptional regulator TrmB